MTRNFYIGEILIFKMLLENVTVKLKGLSAIKKKKKSSNHFRHKEKYLSITIYMYHFSQNNCIILTEK